MPVVRQLFLACMVWAVLFMSPVSVSGAQRLTATADQLRALFVQRLVRYVTWPENLAPKPGEPLIIAATDPDSLRPTFEKNGAAADIKLVQWPAEHYHVLVLTGAPEREVAAILKRVAGRPVLTIGQNPLNPQLGVVVNFQMVGGKLRLQINLQAARKAGLSISSRLLKVAHIYVGENDE